MKGLIHNPVLGGSLLIAGTTLGVGMLAFPTLTVFGGFVPSVILFILIWLLMLCSSFFFLDANLSIKGENNMVTMAQKTLGTWGKLLSWVIYLLLLYSLIAALIAGSTPLFVGAIEELTGYTLPKWLAPFSLPILFGGFIYTGTRGVDLVNRILMLGLIISYCLLVFFVPEQVNFDNLAHFDMPAITIAIPIVITAFGYHIIIPSLTTYMNRDRKKLRKTILIGSFIPIVVYLLWQALVLGAVPFNLLSEAYVKGVTATHPLSQVLHNPYISLAAKLFTFFAIVTTFVGVTLSMSDFLTDGFKIKKSGKGRLMAILLTFVPPLFFVFTYQRGFYIALQFAGAFVAILLVFLPAAMVWKHKNYQTGAKRLLLLLVMAIGIGIVVFDILEESGKLKPLIVKYIQK
ncbi:MAG: Tyrosine-specific transport protein [Chlamydiae bacterium]|nr:Tyrosine-specific transport protein [Chlamydiota bacterium]